MAISVERDTSIEYCHAHPSSTTGMPLMRKERTAPSPPQRTVSSRAESRATANTAPCDADGSVCTEETPIHPTHNLYAATKYEAEKICMQRENSISLRWATVFGVSARMRAGLLLNDFVEKAIHERAVVLYSPHSKRTFMHVRDSVAGYIFALDHADKMRGQIYNMGSNKLNYSKMEIGRAHV